MTPRANLDYVASKLDYKNKGQVIDLYTLRVRRTEQESKEAALAEAISEITNLESSEL